MFTADLSYRDVDPFPSPLAPLTFEEAEKRARRGLAFLQEKGLIGSARPDWVEALDMQSCECCALARATGMTFGYHSEEIGLTDEMEAYYGFDIDCGEEPRFDILTAAWQKVLRELPLPA